MVVVTNINTTSSILSGCESCFTITVTSNSAHIQARMKLIHLICTSHAVLQVVLVKMVLTITCGRLNLD